MAGIGKGKGTVGSEKFSVVAEPTMAGRWKGRCVQVPGEGAYNSMGKAEPKAEHRRW